MPIRYEDITLELADVRSSLESALASPPGPTDDQVWRTYVATERMAAVLKLRMGVEFPGVFSKLPRSSIPEQFLPEASEKMLEAHESLKRGELDAGLASLRAARTLLRGYLAEKHRGRMREKRRAAKRPVAPKT